MEKQRYSTKDILLFVIPSLIGVLLLMTPFTYQGSQTVAVSVLSNSINDWINSIVPIHYVILAVITISCVLSLMYTLFKPKFIENNAVLKDASDVSLFWLFVRLVGMVLGFMTAFKIGPELIWSEDTGGLILYDLIGGLFTIFLVAGFILPFLTEFGLLEYVGVFLTKVMRPLFKLPGRSAVNCIASWIGDGTIGVTLTSNQYEQGYYTEREAAVIATTFSAVSITFCLVVLQNVGLTDYFGHYYMTILVTGFVCALIVPRIPPLSLKKDNRLAEPEDLESDTIPESYSRSQWALKLAVEKAQKNGNVGDFLRNASSTVIGLWLGVTPIIMAVGTLALIVSIATPFFTYLGMPFLPILEFFNVPEAAAASQTMIVGFADMVVPSIMAAEIESEFTRFVVATVSIVQLIYMSETGAVILGSKVPVNLFEIFIIFIERTLVSLPIIILIAHLIF
ncbi:YjiH family protein [Ignavigranum ruoffiae]|uniref:YjiH family protein n=1 Tax=Ignavigranum ruoffiae TaxID=89093 RepID=UPI0024ACFCD1|nr:YjiH family protein [Ignavigranum ruoffiae]